MILEQPTGHGGASANAGWELMLGRLRNRVVTATSRRHRARRRRNSDGSAYALTADSVEAAGTRHGARRDAMDRKFAGEYSVLVVNVQFEGDAVVAAPASELEAAIARAFWGSDRNASRYRLLPDWLADRDVDSAYRAASFGKVRLPSGSSSVVSVLLPGKATDFAVPGGADCDHARVNAPVDAALARAGVLVGIYDFVHYALPRAFGVAAYPISGTVVPGQDEVQEACAAAAAGCCLWAGTAFIEHTLSWSRVLDSYSGTPDVAALAMVAMHEMGHNMGFQHSTSDAEEYGDLGCVMGGAQALVVNSAKAWEAGWLDDIAGSAVDDITGGELGCTRSEQIALVALGAPASRAGRRVVRLPRSDKLGIALPQQGGQMGKICKLPSSWLVSFRGSVGDDVWIGPASVYVHYLKDPEADAATPQFSTVVTPSGLSEGDSFAAGSFAVTVDTIGAETATLSFDFCGSTVVPDPDCEGPDYFPCDENAIEVDRKAAGYYFNNECIAIDSKCGRHIELSLLPDVEIKTNVKVAGRYVRNHLAVCNGRAVYTHMDRTPKGLRFEIRWDGDEYRVVDSTQLCSSGKFFARALDSISIADPALLGKDGVRWELYQGRDPVNDTRLYTEALVTVEPFCRDFDGDGYGAVQTGGLDCNDDDALLARDNAEDYLGTCGIPDGSCLLGRLGQQPGVACIPAPAGKVGYCNHALVCVSPSTKCGRQLELIDGGGQPPMYDVIIGVYERDELRGCNGRAAYVQAGDSPFSAMYYNGDSWIIAPYDGYLECDGTSYMVNAGDANVVLDLIELVGTANRWQLDSRMAIARIPDCTDADADGVGSILTGGVDCDDANPTVWADLDGVDGCDPTPDPTPAPVERPSLAPTSRAPSASPSNGPMLAPSRPPTVESTVSPSPKPSTEPTAEPTPAPARAPSVTPSLYTAYTAPTSSPTASPVAVPLTVPILSPSLHPSVFPTSSPSANPSIVLLPSPTMAPTLPPPPTTTAPISTASPQAVTSSPTATPSSAPTNTPVGTSTVVPSQAPNSIIDCEFVFSSCTAACEAGGAAGTRVVEVIHEPTGAGKPCPVKSEIPDCDCPTLQPTSPIKAPIEAPVKAPTSASTLAPTSGPSDMSTIQTSTSYPVSTGSETGFPVPVAGPGTLDIIYRGDFDGLTQSDKDELAAHATQLITKLSAPSMLLKAGIISTAVFRASIGVRTTFASSVPHTAIIETAAAIEAVGSQATLSNGTVLPVVRATAGAGQVSSAPPVINKIDGVLAQRPAAEPTRVPTLLDGSGDSKTSSKRTTDGTWVVVALVAVVLLLAGVLIVTVLKLRRHRRARKTKDVDPDLEPVSGAIDMESPVSPQTVVPLTGQPNAGSSNDAAAFRARSGTTWEKPGETHAARGRPRPPVLSAARARPPVLSAASARPPMQPAAGRSSKDGINRHHDRFRSQVRAVDGKMVRATSSSDVAPGLSPFLESNDDKSFRIPSVRRQNPLTTSGIPDDDDDGGLPCRSSSYMDAAVSQDKQAQPPANWPGNTERRGSTTVTYTELELEPVRNRTNSYVAAADTSSLPTASAGSVPSVKHLEPVSTNEAHDYRVGVEQHGHQYLYTEVIESAPSDSECDSGITRTDSYVAAATKSLAPPTTGADGTTSTKQHELGSTTGPHDYRTGVEHYTHDYLYAEVVESTPSESEFDGTVAALRVAMGRTKTKRDVDVKDGTLGFA